MKKTGQSFATLASRRFTQFDLGICGSDVCLHLSLAAVFLIVI